MYEPGVQIIIVLSRAPLTLTFPGRALPFGAHTQSVCHTRFLVSVCVYI